MLRVKEFFYSIQGEGFHAGRPAIFFRLAGCNLWSGQGKHKTSSPCFFCDTDFVGGESHDEDYWIEVLQQMSGQTGCKFIVITGGEPTLQVTKGFTDALVSSGLQVAMETNGEADKDYGKDVWITLSPKTTYCKRVKCDELKVLYPLQDIPHVSTFITDKVYIQPIDGVEGSTQAAVEFCKANPSYKLSLQQHKYLGIQ